MAEERKVWIQTHGGSQPGLEASPPEVCDLCSQPLPDVAYDARTAYGPWGWLCPDCFTRAGVGLGLGKGQRYQRQPN